MKVGENLTLKHYDCTLVSLRLDDDVVAHWHRHLHLVLLSSPGHDHDHDEDDGDGDL